MSTTQGRYDLTHKTWDFTSHQGDSSLLDIYAFNKISQYIIRIVHWKEVVSALGGKIGADIWFKHCLAII